MTVFAISRVDIANYVSVLVWVYSSLILIYIIMGWLFSAGVRPPYSRVTDAVIQFIRDVCDPYLRIFRRILPPFGGLDFSPILALIALTVVGRIVVSAIHG
jgi:YggT family protein